MAVASGAVKAQPKKGDTPKKGDKLGVAGKGKGIAKKEKKEAKEKKEKVINTVEDLDTDLDAYIKGRAAAEEAPAAEPAATA